MSPANKAPQIAAGDTIHAALTVREVGPDGDLWCGPVRGNYVVIPPSMVREHKPRALEVGDHVKRRGSDIVWSIQHIFRDWAWIACDDGDSGVLTRLNDLERVC